jgi:hypothetical protein
MASCEYPAFFYSLIKEAIMNRTALFLILISQLFFLVGSVIDPPSSVLMILLRVGVPLIIVGYISLILAGYISPKKR